MLPVDLSLGRSRSLYDNGPLRDDTIRDGVLPSLDEFADICRQSITRPYVLSRYRESTVLRNVLSSYSVFASFPPDIIASLVNEIQCVAYPPGRVIAKAGEQSKSMFIVLDGTVAVHRTDHNSSSSSSTEPRTKSSPTFLQTCSRGVSLFDHCLLTCVGALASARGITAASIALHYLYALGKTMSYPSPAVETTADSDLHDPILVDAHPPSWCSPWLAEVLQVARCGGSTPYCGCGWERMQQTTTPTQATRGGKSVNIPVATMSSPKTSSESPPCPHCRRARTYAHPLFRDPHAFSAVSGPHSISPPAPPVPHAHSLGDSSSRSLSVRAGRVAQPRTAGITGAAAFPDCLLVRSYTVVAEGAVMLASVPYHALYAAVCKHVRQWYAHKTKLLRAVPMFRGCTEEVLAGVAQCSALRVYQYGDIMPESGIVLRGAVVRLARPWDDSYNSAPALTNTGAHARDTASASTVRAGTVQRPAHMDASGMSSSEATAADAPRHEWLQDKRQGNLMDFACASDVATVQHWRQSYGYGCSSQRRPAHVELHHFPASNGGALSPTPRSSHSRVTTTADPPPARPPRGGRSRSRPRVMHGTPHADTTMRGHKAVPGDGFTISVTADATSTLAASTDEGSASSVSSSTSPNDTYMDTTAASLPVTNPASPTHGATSADAISSHLALAHATGFLPAPLTQSVEPGRPSALRAPPLAAPTHPTAHPRSPQGHAQVSQLHSTPALLPALPLPAPVPSAITTTSTTPPPRAFVAPFPPLTPALSVAPLTTCIRAYGPGEYYCAAYPRAADTSFAALPPGPLALPTDALLLCHSEYALVLALAPHPFAQCLTQADVLAAQRYNEGIAPKSPSLPLDFVSTTPPLWLYSLTDMLHCAAFASPPCFRPALHLLYLHYLQRATSPLQAASATLLAMRSLHSISRSPVVRPIASDLLQRLPSLVRAHSTQEALACIAAFIPRHVAIPAVDHALRSAAAQGNAAPSATDTSSTLLVPAGGKPVLCPLLGLPQHVYARLLSSATPICVPPLGVLTPLSLLPSPHSLGAARHAPLSAASSTDGRHRARARSALPLPSAGEPVQRTPSRGPVSTPSVTPSASTRADPTLGYLILSGAVDVVCAATRKRHATHESNIANTGLHSMPSSPSGGGSGEGGGAGAYSGGRTGGSGGMSVVLGANTRDLSYVNSYTSDTDALLGKSTSESGSTASAQAAVTSPETVYGYPDSHVPPHVSFDALDNHGTLRAVELRSSVYVQHAHKRQHCPPLHAQLDALSGSERAGVALLTGDVPVCEDGADVVLLKRYAQGELVGLCGAYAAAHHTLANLNPEVISAYARRHSPAHTDNDSSLSAEAMLSLPWSATPAFISPEEQDAALEAFVSVSAPPYTLLNTSTAPAYVLPLSASTIFNLYRGGLACAEWENYCHLRCHPLLSTLSDGAVLQLALASRVLEVPAGHCLLKQGCMPRGVYFLLSGSIAGSLSLPSCAYVDQLTPAENLALSRVRYNIDQHVAVAYRSAAAVDASEEVLDAEPGNRVKKVGKQSMSKLSADSIVHFPPTRALLVVTLTAGDTVGAASLVEELQLFQQHLSLTYTAATPARLLYLSASRLLPLCDRRTLQALTAPLRPPPERARRRHGLGSAGELPSLHSSPASSPGVPPAQSGVRFEMFPETPRSRPAAPSFPNTPSTLAKTVLPALSISQGLASPSSSTTQPRQTLLPRLRVGEEPQRGSSDDTDVAVALGRSKKSNVGQSHGESAAPAPESEHPQRTELKKLLPKRFFKAEYDALHGHKLTVEAYLSSIPQRQEEDFHRLREKLTAFSADTVVPAPSTPPRQVTKKEGKSPSPRAALARGPSLPRECTVDRWRWARVQHVVARIGPALGLSAALVLYSVTKLNTLLNTEAFTGLHAVSCSDLVRRAVPLSADGGLENVSGHVTSDLASYFRNLRMHAPSVTHTDSFESQEPQEGSTDTTDSAPLTSVLLKTLHRLPELWFCSSSWNALLSSVMHKVRPSCVPPPRAWSIWRGHKPWLREHELYIYVNHATNTTIPEVDSQEDASTLWTSSSLHGGGIYALNATATRTVQEVERRVLRTDAQFLYNSQVYGYGLPHHSITSACLLPSAAVNNGVDGSMGAGMLSSLLSKEELQRLAEEHEDSRKRVRAERARQRWHGLMWGLKHCVRRQVLARRVQQHLRTLADIFVASSRARSDFAQVLEPAGEYLDPSSLAEPLCTPWQLHPRAFAPLDGPGEPSSPTMEQHGLGDRSADLAITLADSGAAATTVLASELSTTARVRQAMLRGISGDGSVTRHAHSTTFHAMKQGARGRVPKKPRKLYPTLAAELAAAVDDSVLPPAQTPESVLHALRSANTVTASAAQHVHGDISASVLHAAQHGLTPPTAADIRADADLEQLMRGRRVVMPPPAPLTGHFTAGMPVRRGGEEAALERREQLLRARESVHRALVQGQLQKLYSTRGAVWTDSSGGGANEVEASLAADGVAALLTSTHGDMREAAAKFHRINQCVSTKGLAARVHSHRELSGAHGYSKREAEETLSKVAAALPPSVTATLAENQDYSHFDVHKPLALPVSLLQTFAPPASDVHLRRWILRTHGAQAYDDALRSKKQRFLREVIASEQVKEHKP